MSLLRPLLLFSSTAAALGITACTAPDDSFEDAQWREGDAPAGSPDCGCPMCSCWTPTHDNLLEDRLTIRLHEEEQNNGLPFLDSPMLSLYAISADARLSARFSTKELELDNDSRLYKHELELSRWKCQLIEDEVGGGPGPALPELPALDVVDVEDAVDPVAQADCRRIAYDEAVAALEELEELQELQAIEPIDAEHEDAISALNQRFKIIVSAGRSSISLQMWRPGNIMSPQ